MRNEQSGALDAASLVTSAGDCRFPVRDRPTIDGWRSSGLGLLGRFEEARALHATTSAAFQERGARIGEAPCCAAAGQTDRATTELECAAQ